MKTGFAAWDPQISLHSAQTKLSPIFISLAHVRSKIKISSYAQNSTPNRSLSSDPRSIGRSISRIGLSKFLTLEDTEC